jgi:hypothetical protein
MGFFKTTTGVVVGLVAVIALFTAIGIGSAHFDNWFSSKTAEPRGQKAVRENTQANGAFRQAAYEGFFELCSAAQTDQDQIETLVEEKKDASPDRVDNLNTSISALKFSLSETVNEYNTKANEYTRAQFLDNKLPYPLNAKDTIQCV